LLVTLKSVYDTIGSYNRVKPKHMAPDLWGNEGPMSHQDIMRSIALFGREIIPALHEITRQPYA